VKRVPLVVAAAALVLAAPAAADLAPLGSAKGVTMRFAPRLTIRFTTAATTLYRSVRGKRVDVECITFSREPAIGGGRGESGTGTQVVVRGRTVTVGLGQSPGGGFDVCVLKRAGRELVAVPMSATGRTYLDERDRARVVLALVSVTLGTKDRPGKFMSPADVVALTEGQVVALSGPGERPPADTPGYWSDGEQHAYAAMVSAEGRVLFAEVNGDVITSNVLQYAFGEI
jgi:hypothetical protein